MTGCLDSLRTLAALGQARRGGTSSASDPLLQLTSYHISYRFFLRRRLLGGFEFFFLSLPTSIYLLFFETHKFLRFVRIELIQESVGSATEAASAWIGARVTRSSDSGYRHIRNPRHTVFYSVDELAPIRPRVPRPGFPGVVRTALPHLTKTSYEFQSQNPTQSTCPCIFRNRYYKQMPCQDMFSY